MKKKIIIYFCISILLVLGLIFASSKVQALSRQEGLGRNQELREEIRNNRINKRENNQSCINVNCINRDSQCLPKTHNCRRNCNR